MIKLKRTLGHIAGSKEFFAWLLSKMFKINAILKTKNNFKIYYFILVFDKQ